MAKLKVLELNQTVMSAIDIYPRSSEATSKFKASQLLGSSMCLFMLTAIILSAVYIYQGSTRLSYILDACIVFIAVSQAFFAYLNMKRKMDSVKSLQLKLQEIVDQGMAIFQVRRRDSQIKTTFLLFLLPNYVQPKVKWC